MKKLLSLLIFDLLVAILGGAPTLSANPQTASIKINHDQVAFVQDDELRLMISKNCYEPKKKHRCQALEALRKVSYEKIKSKLQGGKPPGMTMCEETLKAQVIVGTDQNGDQNSFCMFSDGSMINIGTLTHYGIQNDQHRK